VRRLDNRLLTALEVLAALEVLMAQLKNYIINYETTNAAIKFHFVQLLHYYDYD
jgi:hypothetical protein